MDEAYLAKVRQAVVWVRDNPGQSIPQELLPYVFACQTRFGFLGTHIPIVVTDKGQRFLAEQA